MSDIDGYAMGGVSGHAGLFSDALDMTVLLRALLDARLVNASTVAAFTTIANASQSSRALGWDTNAPGSYLGCVRAAGPAARARARTHTRGASQLRQHVVHDVYAHWLDRHDAVRG